MREHMVINQMIEVQSWSNCKPLLYCDGGLSVRPANAESGGLRQGL